MQKVNALLGTVVVPLIAVSGLWCGIDYQAHVQVRPDSPQETSPDLMKYPASVNLSRCILLRQQYQCYQSCLAEKPHPQTPSGLIFWQTSLEEAVDNYNIVADETDPSAFQSLSLPTHLYLPDNAQRVSR